MLRYSSNGSDFKIIFNILEYNFLCDILGLHKNIIWGLKISKTILAIKPLKPEMYFSARYFLLWAKQCKTKEDFVFIFSLVHIVSSGIKLIADRKE